MFNKKLLLLPLLLLTVLISSIDRLEIPQIPLDGFDAYNPNMKPDPNMPFNPNMSEEEIFNQLMEGINAALPEEMRELFWQEVAQETERLERETAHMSPEEKDAYFENILREAGMDIPMEHAEPVQEPTMPEVPVKTVEQLVPSVKETTETTDDVIKIINNIIKSIESFITKAASFADFDGKVTGWVQKGRITDWQGVHWSEFQHELHKFITVLQRFKEKDSKIGFKHLDELRKNELVMQNLKQLQKKLADYEASIVITPFEIANMSEQTKNACIHVINALTDAIYRNKIVEELLKIIEKFDPTAKKIREEEEKFSKSALIGARQDVNVPIRTVGKREPKGDSFQLPSFDDFGIGGDRRPSFDYTRGRYPGSEKMNDDKKDVGGKDQKGGTGGSGGGKPGGKAPDAKKSDGTEAKSPDASKGSKKTDATKKEPAQIKHAEAKKNLEDLFRRDLEDVDNIIRETPEFQNKENLKQYLLPVIPPAA